MHRNDSGEQSAGLETWLHSPYPLWVMWIIWLPFVIPGMVKLFQSHPSLPHLLFSLAGIALFVSVYLWATWRNIQQRLLSQAVSRKNERREAWLSLLLLTALSVALSFSDGQGLFIFVSAYASASLSLSSVAGVVALLALLNAVTGRLIGMSWLDLAQPTFLIVVVGALVLILVQWIETNRKLQAAREEIAHFAALEERLRIARDLHDLLGHNLSLITLKSELAGHLLEANAERAALATEINDIENVSRSTLQEVREAVAGYRSPSLLRELREAQTILTSANIVYHFAGDTELVYTLPPKTAAVLAWAVREGVTNIVRHSQARQCTIQVQQKDHEIQVEILNNGPARAETATSALEDTTAASDASRDGNGLRGLSERLAMLGGRCEAHACEGGGFSLTVSVPLVQEKSGERQIDALASQTPLKGIS